MSIPESTYFAHDKEQLLNTLRRFEGDIKVEDVVDGASHSSHSYDAKHYHSVLLQILLEGICKDFVEGEFQREALLKELCKQLSKMKLVDLSLTLDKHNPLRIKIRKKFYEFVNEILRKVIPGKEIDSNVKSYLESSNLSSEPNACYYKCFEELDEIGKGGFGIVYKAKDKLTQHIYAVKKISFSYKNDARYLQVMREAKNIAALDHTNIVRYNNAWLEILHSDADDDASDNSDNSDESGSENEVPVCTDGISAIVMNNSYSYENSNSCRTEICDRQYEEPYEDYNSSESVIFSNSADIPHNDVNWVVGNESGDSEDTNFSEETHAVEVSLNYNLNVRVMLYIQMEYCDSDLRKWMDKRAERKELPFNMDITEIFTNILKGLVHIHSKGIIHRDLKPQNIFYSKASNSLKIGDFGLATLADCTSFSSDVNHVSNFHSSNIGTIPYAAPEQIASKSYNSKVDIYSLGIILIELLNVFSTKMELFDTIREVKLGKVTKAMEKFTDLVSVVPSLTSENPNNRMSAKEILVRFESDEKVLKLEIKRLRKRITELEVIIHEKDEIICQKDEEIKRLLDDNIIC